MTDICVKTLIKVKGGAYINGDNLAITTSETEKQWPEKSRYMPINL